MTTDSEQAVANVAVISDDFAHPLHGRMLNEITRQLALRGGVPLLLNSTDAVAQLASQIQINGAIFLGDMPADAALATVPAVHLCSAHAEAIGVDDYTAGVEMGRLLLSQGYERFGYLSVSDLRSQRLAGYAAALATENIRLDVVLTAGGSDRELAWQAMTTYLKQARSSERINALFCENDLLAFGAIQAIRDFGQGVRIGVVGFDDVDEARASTWHLTSWSQPHDLQVAEALNRLLEERTDINGAWREGQLQCRHSHLGKAKPGEMSQCGCAIRH